MKQWIRSHGWLLFKTEIPAGAQITIDCNYTGSRRQLDQITMIVQGSGREDSGVRWQPGTCSQDLAPVQAGQWQVQVDPGVPVIWLCLDQRYNREPLPEVRMQIIPPDQDLVGPGIFYLAQGELEQHSGSFELQLGQRVPARTQSVIIQFNRKRNAQT
jgi:hypothetical protein